MSKGKGNGEVLGFRTAAAFSRLRDLAMKKAPDAQVVIVAVLDANGLHTFHDAPGGATHYDVGQMLVDAASANLRQHRQLMAQVRAESARIIPGAGIDVAKLAKLVEKPKQ